MPAAIGMKCLKDVCITLLDALGNAAAGKKRLGRKLSIILLKYPAPSGAASTSVVTVTTRYMILCIGVSCRVRVPISVEATRVTESMKPSLVA